MSSTWLSSRAQFCAIAFMLLHSVDACQSICQSPSCLPSCSLAQPHACGAKVFQPDEPATDQDLIRLLGGSTGLRELKTRGGDEVISQGNDLDCVGPEFACRWRNALPAENIDDFDWGYGEGSPDSEQWLLLTGSEILPQEPFFLTGSTPANPERSSALLSDVIGCQEANGRLSFKYWTSRSRVPGQQPTITVCYKHTGEETLLDCQPVTPIGSDPKSASVIIHGPIARPFQLVISAAHFVNEPEGGFIVVGDIQLRALVKNSCGVTGSADDQENDQEGDQEYEEEQPVPVGASDVSGVGCPLNESEMGTLLCISSGELELLRPKHPSKAESEENEVEENSSSVIDDVLPSTPTPTIKPSRKANVDSCKLLACDFQTAGNFCRLNPVGLGANGIGERVGWQVLLIRRNPTNPLTGIQAGYIKNPDGPIAVASFPDPRQEPEEENLQFSLESGMLHFTETHYLTFKKYLATAGVQLMVCLDPNAKKCFWKSAPLTFRATQAQRNRAWSTELIQIPQGSYKLFLLARYDNSQRFNAGQIGLGYVRLFRDAQLKIPLC